MITYSFEKALELTSTLEVFYKTEHMHVIVDLTEDRVIINKAIHAFAGDLADLKRFLNSKDIPLEDGWLPTLPLYIA